MSDSLVGVIIGGLLTLCTTIAIEVQKTRSTAVARRKNIAAIARVLEDNLWVSEVLICAALSSGRWWRAARNPLHVLNAEDMRVLATELDMSSWG